MRLNLASPLLKELDQRHIDYSGVLQTYSVNALDITDPDVLVPAPRMYALLERLSELSGDPYFGVEVGRKIDPLRWSPMIRAAQKAATIAEFLLRFIEEVGHSATSVTYTLSAAASRTTFQQRRFTDGGIRPAHNDGFTVACLLTLLRKSTGAHWQGSEVIAQVCNPSVIPPRYLGVRVAASDTLGACISFPTRWLLAKPAFTPARSRAGGVDATATTQAPSSLVAALRKIMLPHIHEFNLDAARVAKILGYSRRTMDRILRENGTSARREVAALRRAIAEQELRESDQAVSTIGARVGYENPAVFSRAFRDWTGISPREYRRTHRMKSGG